MKKGLHDKKGGSVVEYIYKTVSRTENQYWDFQGVCK